MTALDDEERSQRLAAALERGEAKPNCCSQDDAVTSRI
jgi:hypothetical protein